MINISHLEGVEGAVGPLRGLFQKWGFTGFCSWGQCCQLPFLFKIMIFCLRFSRVSFLNFPSGMGNEQLTVIISGVIILQKQSQGTHSVNGGEVILSNHGQRAVQSDAPFVLITTDYVEKLGLRMFWDLSDRKVFLSSFFTFLKTVKCVIM